MKLSKKTVIISDTHLGKKFNLKKFTFLKKLFEEYEFVIINGDLWDDFQCTFDEFINSEWSRLFPILKKKRAIYIYGNHDIVHKMDERVYTFCEKLVHNFEFKLETGPTIRVEHGQGVSSITRFLDAIFENHIRLFKLITRPPALLAKIHMFLSKHNIYIFDKLKNYPYKLQNIKSNNLLIIGHTHAPEIDLKKRFINSGFIDNSYATFVSINNGNISLHRKHFK